MLFNSIDFALYLPVVFLFYWFVTNTNLKSQNVLIVISSYVFYGWWDWRFLLLILLSTFTDYIVGLKLNSEDREPKRIMLLWISIIFNLGILGFFKYYNFFLDNFITAFKFFGQDIPGTSLRIVLPVGISFYTFQTLSYTIDVYKRKLKPTSDFIAFSAFVSFFPQLVAGPIERAADLLPQFYKERVFNYSLAIDGLRQILWGLFKKMVIADNCAWLANDIFNNSADLSGSVLLLGAFFFAFQIYGDFSGYSDIAIGCSRLFGFKLSQNFAFPYFSRDIAEFWRRWHISLSSWFRDYLYVPLGGSRGSVGKKVRNIFIIFLVSGFWHGANWTFIVWGGLNALYFLPLLLTRKNRKNMEIVAHGRKFPTVKECLNIMVTFSLTLVAWVFFRAESVAKAISYLNSIFSRSLFTFPEFKGKIIAVTVLSLVAFLIFFEWKGRSYQHALQFLDKRWVKPYRYLLYYIIAGLIFWFGGQKADFIYFQF